MFIEQDPLREKYDVAFCVMDDETRSGCAEKDWVFFEEKGVLIAEPKISGSGMYWNGQFWIDSCDNKIVW